MTEAIGKALEVGAIDPQAVALLARHESHPADEPSQLTLDVGDLACFARPEPDIHAYEALIGRAS